MSDRVTKSSEPNVAVLIREIVADARKLLRQEIDLGRTEIASEWKKLKAAVVASAAIVVVLSAAVVLTGQTLAHLIRELTSAPIWVGYGISALVSLAVGAALYAFPRKEGRGRGDSPGNDRIH